ncbi:MAG: 50S ribosomal protein L9 [Candidatus Hydrogenedentales bacterium]
MADAPAQPRRDYLLGLLIVATAFAFLPAVGLVVAAAAVAVNVAQARWAMAVLFVAVAGAAGTGVAYVGSLDSDTIGGWRAALEGLYGALGAAVLGGFIGGGIAMRLRFGMIVTAATLASFVVFVIPLAMQSKTFEEMHAQTAATLAGPDAPPAGRDRMVLESVEWLLGHWKYLYVGVAFASALVSAAFAAYAAAFWLRRKRTLEGVSGFRSMQPPDWLVWFLILAAGLWFLDQYRPNEWVRMAGWNLALALAAVYWLNGLSVLTYAVAVLRPHPALVVLLMATLIFIMWGSALLFIGLFDTWGEFRPKLDRLAAERHERQNGGAKKACTPARIRAPAGRQEMKVILCEEVDNLGEMGQTVSVSSGYARNFLIPRKLAVAADSASARQIEHEMHIIRRREEKLRQKYGNVKKSLDGAKVEFSMKAGEEGKLYGSVTSLHIAEKLAELGHDVDRKKIQLREPIRTTGEHEVTIKLVKDLNATVRVIVEAEAAPEEAPAEQLPGVDMETAGGAWVSDDDEGDDE